jgi:GNAT superfamily N-acetyltransferase
MEIIVMGISIRKAGSDEAGIAFAMLKEAAVWLQQRGIDYWQNWHNPPPSHIKWILNGFDHNEFFFAEQGTEIVGCFRLQWEDPMFWGPRHDGAGYIHSFTVVRRLAGQGIGREILSLIESHCRGEGKQFLRLDCGMHVPGLRKYYENAGFGQAGEIAFAGEQLVLYEKPLGHS